MKRKVNKMHNKYIDELLADQSCVDIGLKKDYVIIYEYLMELLGKDNIVGPFLVKKELGYDRVNADIFLDFTKHFNIFSYEKSPYMCLINKTRNNTKKPVEPHPFLNNNNFTLISHKITQSIWNALNNGFTKIGVFVRGHRDDIYELKLSSHQHKDDFVQVFATSEDVFLKINIRIIIKHTVYSQHGPIPYPHHILKKEWLAMVPLRQHYMFDVYMPNLENDIITKYFNIVMLQRFLRYYFIEHKFLYHLKHRFLESAVYYVYLNTVRKTNANLRICYFLKEVLIIICRRFKNKNFPSVFNQSLNLMQYFERDVIPASILRTINGVILEIDKMNCNKNLSYEDFFNYYGLKLEFGHYVVDQFGIYKDF